MGQRRKNVEAVTDYADNRHFIRLHRDIALPAAACEAVRRHLTAGRWLEAKRITLEHASPDSYEEIELFFTAAAQQRGAAHEGEVTSTNRMNSFQELQS
ncbi:MAG TPA: hypothetical protein VE988_05765 [Gemmataceae bacterium]|nr:hypothetical protein [Gemmataceae bacterium]